MWPASQARCDFLMELLGSELAAGAAEFPSRVAMRSVPTIPSHATKPVSLHARSMIAALKPAKQSWTVAVC
jgi:hypothetical protein